jgi:coenzyme F420-reducing hydrogenase delta subunit
MNGLAVIACARADLGRAHLPAGARVMQVPCVGRVSAALLLTIMSRGADGVLVLGRKQDVCRLAGSEDPAREVTERVDRVLALLGLGTGRVRFDVAELGGAGPGRAVEGARRAVAALGPSPLVARRPVERDDHEGLDESLGLCAWMAAQPDLRPDVAPWLAGYRLPGPAPGQPLLVAGTLAHLDLLADRLLRPLRVAEVLRSALATLEALGASGAGVWPGLAAGAGVAHLKAASAVYTLAADDAAAASVSGVRAVHVCDLICARREALKAPPVRAKVACDAGGPQAELVRTLGYEPVDVGPGDASTRFALSPAERARAEVRLVAAEHAGAQAILVPGTTALARMAMMSRQGAWRSTRVRPVSPCQLESLARRGVSLTARVLAEEVAHA